MPKFYQDSEANPVQLGFGEQGQRNAQAWNDNPKAWTPQTKWWEPVAALATPFALGPLAGFGGFGGGAGAAAGAATPTASSIGMPISQAARGVSGLTMGAAPRGAQAAASFLGSSLPAASAATGVTTSMGPLGLILGLAGIGGNIFSGITGAQAANDQNKLSRDQLALQERMFNQQMGQQQAAAGLAATQMNPFAQQRSRAAQALLGSLMANYQPAKLEGNHYTGGIFLPPEVFSNLTPFLSPGAMGASERAFHQTAQAASPTYNIPDYQYTGYGTGMPSLAGAPTGPNPNTMQQAQPRANSRLPQIAQSVAQGQGQNESLGDRLRRLRGGQ